MKTKTEWSKTLNNLDVLYVEYDPRIGRRYLRSTCCDINLAEQITPSGDAEKWARKKIVEREESTGKYVEKIKDQLARAEDEHARWKQLRILLGLK